MAKHTKKVNHVCTFPLIEKEFAQYGRDVLKLQAEINHLDLDLKRAKEDHKAAVTTKENEMQRLMQIIRAGKEDREVTCDEVLDFDKGTVRYYYEGKLMEERAMRPEERQMNMNVVPMQRD